MAKIGYSYTALNDSEDFRLVYLEPYQPEETTPSLRCAITHTKFVGSPKYTALSYMWGPPSDTMPLVLKGQEIQVKKNLYSALWHLRQYQHKHHEANGYAYGLMHCVSTKKIPPKELIRYSARVEFTAEHTG
jgi:hypothetical protein